LIQVDGADQSACGELIGRRPPQIGNERQPEGGNRRENPQPYPHRSLEWPIDPLAKQPQTGANDRDCKQKDPHHRSS
jgi:hypothetical protein